MKENRLQLRYLIYKEEETGGAKRLFDRFSRYPLTVIPAKAETLADCIKRNKVPLESVLALAATDKTIQEAKELCIAVLAWRNHAFPLESLYGTEFLVESLEELDYYFLERVYQRKHNLPWRVIETRRCYLREITLSDLPELYELYGQKGMTDYMEPLYDREEEEAYTKAYISHMYRYYGYGMWLVKDRNTDELIGRAGFDHFETDGECFLEMGYAVSVYRQRQGYGFEICRALIEYAKEADLGFAQICCLVRSGNAASIALLEKLGFCFADVKVRGGRELLRYVFDLNEEDKY